MNKIIEQLPLIKLVGISKTTSNELEKDPNTAKIGIINQKFFAENLQVKISSRKNSGRVFAVYTQYASDEYGSYTYFLGEEVNDFVVVEPGFETLMIPAQTYVKFTSSSGKIPNIIIDLWKKIWKMNSIDLGGARAYIADFEIYDERSLNPDNAIIDIYLGIRVIKN